MLTSLRRPAEDATAVPATVLYLVSRLCARSCATNATLALLMTSVLYPVAARASNSLWSSAAVPATTWFEAFNPQEVGVKFRSDLSGHVIGLRFYKGSGDTATSHVGHLWTSGGTLLATATFTNETSSGWQQVTFSNPVAINANTVYVASYYHTSGRYAFSAYYFTGSHDRPPLHALASGSNGPNGVYSNGSGFPVGGYEQGNYWVDVVFSPGVSTSGSGITLSSVSPSSSSISGGGTVQLQGSNFHNGAGVSFGGTQASGTSFISSTQINVVAPSHAAGNVDVSVTNPDGSSATLPGAFTYNSPSTSGGSVGSLSGVIFQDSFQRGDFSAWGTACSLYSSDTPFINSNPAFVYSGLYSLGLHYYVAANPSGGNRDDNRACWLPLANLTHFFIRGYVYVGPLAGGSMTSNIQRKFFYLKQQGTIYPWSVILDTFANPDGTMGLAYVPSPPQDGAFQAYRDNNISWNIATLHLNTWYSLELEVLANTPGQRDGYINVWVNGTQVLNRTGLNVRGFQTNGINVAGIGEQVNTLSTGFIDEYRYWDSIVVSTSYIGP